MIFFSLILEVKMKQKPKSKSKSKQVDAQVKYLKHLDSIMLRLALNLELRKN